MLAHESSRIVPATDPQAGTVMHDVYEALVENASPISADAIEGARHLEALRNVVRAAGGTPAGAGIHPASPFGDAPHVVNERYRVIGEQMRGLLRRTPTCALHVHVGMPDPETAIRAFNRMRQHLPALQALAAHSPYWHGIDSGFQTARAQLFRGYPRADIPRAFADWDDYVETMDALVAAADVEDYTFFWWDLRPHPKLGTLEVRAMDAQARIGSVCGLAALVHGLVLAAVARAGRGRAAPARGARRVVLPRRARRPRRHGLARRRAAAGARADRGGASSSPAATRRPSRRSRRSSASCARATAPTACAPPTREGGMPRVLHRLIEESAEALEVPARAA